MKTIRLIFLLSILPLLMAASYPIPIPGSTGNSMVSNGSKWTSAATTGAATQATNSTNIAIINDTTTNATVYPTWVTATTGNLPAKTSSTKWTFNPSTGAVTAGSFIGALTGNASTATALAADPGDCASNTYATTIAASGALTCASITNASTTAVSTNTNSTIVLRDGSGNFSAGTISAALTGTASGNLTATANQYGVLLSGSANAAVVLAPDASTVKYLKSGGTGANPSWAAVTSTPVDSYVYYNTGNGHGGTNTKIRRWTTLVGSNGSDLTYADSSTNGMTVTVNTAGIYAVTYCDAYSAGTMGLGISVNSNQLTTNLGAITASMRVGYTETSVLATSSTITAIIYAAVNDVIRTHDNGNGDDASVRSYFIVRRIL